MNNSIQAINVKDKLAKVSTFWDPKLVGEINGQEVKVVKLKDEFVWHDHKDADELFLVIKGHLVIHFRDKDVHASEGEIIIVPKGVEHKPETISDEVEIILIDPKGTVNTGDVQSELTRDSVEEI